MPNTEEQRLDVIENCTILIDGILKPFEQTDDTPEGRMITQLKWLKERAENHDLPLPVDKGKLASLLYIYTNGNITHLASSEDKIREEVEIHMKRIIKLCHKGKLLYKNIFRPYLLVLIDALAKLLKSATRPLSEYEQGMIGELETLKQRLEENCMEPPLMSYLPDYPNFNEVFVFFESTIDDLPNGKILCETVANLIFEGIRPDNWLTPEDADKETQQYMEVNRST